MNNLHDSYTILLPLYKEAEIVDKLIQAMIDLVYPKKLLQILILLEADDKETIDAISQKKLPPYFSILIVPDHGPKTKARACNYGLEHATGKYLVIYDAEDIPETDQLLVAVQTFKKHNDPELACLQAKLTFYNHSENLLTKLCTLEYLVHFNFILPGFSENGVPVPLGGTSNHFKLQALRKIHGWDAYNVTEDADITYRLSRKNYKIKMLDSYTSEETVIDVKSWIKQRSRWVKGHIITFLVQSRTGFPKHQNNRVKCIFSLYYFMGLSFAITLSVPLLIVLFIPYLFNSTNISEKIDPVTKYIFLFYCMLWVYCTLIIPLFLIYKEQKTLLFKACFLYPFYLLLYTMPFCCALFQLLFKPHYWEKTAHGKSSVKVIPHITKGRMRHKEIIKSKKE